MTWLALLLFVGVAYSVNPILFFPGYSLSKLQVTVTNGQLAGCPTSGNFTVQYTMEKTQNGFDEQCMMNFLNLTYNAGAQAPNMFSNRADVSISIPGRETGNISCLGSSIYDGMVNFFVGKGYTTGTSSATLMAACYDWRMDPTNDVITGPGFMNNTQTLVEQLYANAGNQKVWLIGHSNGPLMQLYFLTHVSNEFKQKYIAGFIPLSGNFAGQGLFPCVYVYGLSVADFSFYEPSKYAHFTWPADYFSGPQPAVFTGNNSLTFFKTLTPARSYTVTVADINSFLEQAGNTYGRNHWQEWAGLVGPHTPPGTYTYAIWGANIDTLVGLEIGNFTNTTINNYLTLPGDVNQEYIDNESCKKWKNTMPEGCFDFYEADKVDHFALSSDANVLAQMWTIISRGAPTMQCTGSTTSSTSDAATQVLSVFVMMCALIVALF
jgi:lysophospholipase-3